MALSKSDKIAIWCTVGSLFVTPIVTVVYDYISKAPIFTSLLSGINWIFNGAIAVLTFKVSIWVVLLCVLGLIIIAFFLNNDMGKDRYTGFAFNSYTEDVLKGRRWSWSYEFDNVNNTYTIIRLTAYCPHCHSPLRGKHTLIGNFTECVRCETEIHGDIYDDTHAIELLIEDNIRRKQKAARTVIEK